MNSKISKVGITMSIFILIASLSRLFPHPPNFTAMGAFVLMGTALLNRNSIIVLSAVAIYFVTDLALNNVIYSSFYEGSTIVSPMFKYIVLSFMAIGLVGKMTLKKLNVNNFLFASILSAIAFFLISNFGVWQLGLGYPPSFEGLVACYTAGLPFIAYDLAGLLLYSGVFYIVYVKVFESKWAWARS